MWRDEKDALLDMRQACQEVLEFAGDLSPEALELDTLRLRAIERSLSILGEAAKRVGEDFKSRWPQVPWRAMAGLRDVLVHDYFGVDVQVVWQVVREELPTLLVQLEEILREQGRK